MIYQYKHTNLPMSLLEIKIRQGGWHEYNYYFDMGRDNSTLFSDIHGSYDRNFPQPRHRMDTLHRPKDNIRMRKLGHYDYCGHVHRHETSRAS